MSASNASSTVLNLLMFDTDSQSLVASVISANPTATALLLACPPGTDNDDCGTYNETVTVGPWAAPNAAATATGVYDDSVIEVGEWTFSIHCAMSATVPATCTTINIGGNNDGTPTMTYTSPASDDDVMGWGYMPVTITAGAEKLASVSATTTAVAQTGKSASTGSAGVTSSGSAVSGSSAGSASGAKATGSSSVSASSSAASASSSGNAAAGTHGSGVESLALAGVLLAWFMR